MMHRTVRIKYRSKTIEIPVKQTGVITRGVGLMFRTRNTANLVFDFSCDVRTPFTSLFVFFSYVSIWLDEHNNVIAWRVVTPFTPNVTIDKPFRRVVEVPINKTNSEILAFFRRGSPNV